MPENRRFKLVRRPVGEPRADDFALVSEPPPAPGQGEFVIRKHYASLDPAIRRRLDDEPSYVPAVELGAVIGTSTIGVVTESRSRSFEPGQWVVGFNALEDFSVATEGGFTRVVDPEAVPRVTNYLSVMGAVGMTAYFGLLEVCKPQPGDTVLVTAAAGAVGSIVGQIARIKGCRTIGIAGGPEKCRRLTDRYRYDAAIDYHGKDRATLEASIRAVSPAGVNIIFENVGGDILDAGLMNLAGGARVGLCGLISEYNQPARIGARNLWQLIVKRASIRGLLVVDYIERFGEGGAEMSRWLAEGELVVDEHVDAGLENAYAALMRLFSGSNHGKMILKIA